MACSVGAFRVRILSVSIVDRPLNILVDFAITPLYCPLMQRQSDSQGRLDSAAENALGMMLLNWHAVSWPIGLAYLYFSV